MKIIISVNASGVVNGKTVESIGNIQVVYRNSFTDDTFSVSFINRMNNQSITLHKFAKTKFVVEFGSPQGVDHVMPFKVIEVALQLAVLNTDITRIEEEDAIEARRKFVMAVARYDSKAKYVKFPEHAWKLNKFRNKPIIFDGPDGERQTGILNLVLPPTGEKCLVTPDDNKAIRLMLLSDKLWLQ